MKENYLTVESGRVLGPEELREKGSRFFAYLYEVKTAEQADAAIASLWKKYHDATHVCFAFRLGEGSETYFRYNDDGEPSGTAGAPIYNEIKSKDFFNVLVAVVRYYGGTKLGTGGLARAYGGSARLLLNTVKPLTIHIKKEASLTFPYDLTGDVMPLIQRFGLEIKKQDYTADGVAMTLGIPVARVDETARAVIDATNGKLKLDLNDA